MEFNTDFSYVLGCPNDTAIFRLAAEDFVVVEDLGYEPDGEGEHLFLHIKKIGENTSWVAQQLAKFLGVKENDVGYCGKKDRHAVTTQWFSVYLPNSKQDFNWDTFITESDLNIEVLSCSRHRKKLRRGEHLSNYFDIYLHGINDVAEFTKRANLIEKNGVPNYFGEQRFGRDYGNLNFAQKWFVEGEAIRNRGKRGMIMSAARSYLFNLVLSIRVEQGNWSSIGDGDIAIDQWPSGPLWGRGRSPASGTAADLESQVLSPFSSWLNNLEHLGLKQERRSFVLLPQNFHFELMQAPKTVATASKDQATIKVSFRLPPGQFATTVLRELVLLDNKSQM